MPKRRPDGYVPELFRGQTRHRVRVEGDKRKRITIPVGPDHPDFWEHYYAARSGRKVDETSAVAKTPRHHPRSLRVQLNDYLSWLSDQVDAGKASPLTLKQRRSLLAKICDFPDDRGDGVMGDLNINLPQAAMIHIQDQWGSKTAQADNSVKALSAFYRWAIPRGRASANPATGIAHVHKSQGGATPWSADDLKAFLQAHPVGTPARTYIMLAIWTAARIGDLHWLGRAQEVKRAGRIWIDWQPTKRGSKPVSVPMAPELFEATRAGTVIGSAYILSPDTGKPYSTADSLAERVRKWTADAGLSRRSSHGLRKATGALLAEAGATQHQIMSVMAHSKAQTSAIYTESADRAALAAAAMDTLEGFRIG